MSRTARLFAGTTVAYLHQAALIIVGLWLTPFLLGRIGQRDLGLWLVAGQVLGYLSLLDLGVLGILPREVALLSGGGNDAETSARIAALLRRIRRIVGWQSLGLAIVSAVIWWRLPADWAPIATPMALVLVSFVLLYPLRVAAGVLQGLQEHPFLAKVAMFGWLSSTLVTIGLVLAGAHLFALVAGWIVNGAVPALAATWRLRQRLGGVNPSDDGGETQSYLARSAWSSVGQVAHVMLSGSDLLILGHLLGPAAVVSYACTGKLVTVFANHPQLLMHAAQPALAELRSAGEKEHLARVATALAQTMMIMSGALVVIILPANEFFVNWWVGSGLYGGALLSAAFVVMMVLRHLNITAAYTLFCFGQERQLAFTALLDGALTIGLTVWLLSAFGPIGAPLGSIAGALLVSLPVNSRSVARELGLTSAQYVWRVVPLLARVVGVAALGVAWIRWLAPASVWTMALAMAPVPLLYLGLILPLALRGPAEPYVRRVLAPIIRWSRWGAARPAAGEAGAR